MSEWKQVWKLPIILLWSPLLAVLWLGYQIGVASEYINFKVGRIVDWTLGQ
jgi:hypothetical protein